MTAYLDHAASTPVRPEVREAMMASLCEPGNPSGAHAGAQAARKAIDDVRDVLASLLGAEPGEVVFTSGGTESDNLAVLGTLDRVGGTAVCSAIEHHAVLDAVAARGGRTVAVTPAGTVDLDDLGRVLDELTEAGESPTIVSVMAVNNETGIVQPVADVVEVVRRHAPGALVHTDAVQAFAWTDVAALVADADLVTVSAHKFGGPKGAGALVVRARAEASLSPRAIGGGQERGRRSGTPNVAGIVGMGVAATLAADERTSTVERVGALRDRLADTLVAAVPGVAETAARRDGTGAVDRSDRVAGTCHVCIEGVDSESLLFLLDREGIAASAASSCSSGALDPSHVLGAMGVPRELAGGSLRLSLGWSSSDADVDAALAAIGPAVERLRMFS